MYPLRRRTPIARRTVEANKPAGDAHTNMPEITIECPETGREISTGIDAPVDFFAHSQARGNETSCPHCDRPHVWDAVAVVSEHAKHVE